MTPRELELEKMLRATADELDHAAGMLDDLRCWTSARSFKGTVAKARTLLGPRAAVVTAIGRPPYESKP